MTEPDNDEISLLDLLIVVAENWLLLVIAPLAIGGIVYWVVASQPQTYSSDAVVALPPAEIVEFVDAGVSSGSLPPQFVLSGPDMEGLAVAPIPNATDVPEAIGNAQSQLTLTQRDPTGATTLDRLVQALQAAVQEGQLTDPALELAARADRLEAALAMRESAIGQLGEILAEPTQTSADAEVYAWSAIALDQMLSGRSADETELATLRQALTATGGEIVVVAPSTPRAQGRSPLLMAILTVLGSGFVFLILVFVRAGIRHAASEGNNKVKLERIRNAILLRRTR